MSGAIVVSISRGDQSETTEYRSSRSPITIGRDEGNDVAIASKFVSARHVRIEVENDELIVHDLNSTNGTHVKNNDGTRRRLTKGQPHRFPHGTGEFFLGETFRVCVRTESRRAQPDREVFPVDLPDAIPAAGLDSLSLDGLPSLPGAAIPRQSAMPAMPPMTPVAPRSPAASVWDAPPQSSPQLGTQQFQLSTENLALAGLRELVASLSPGRSLDSQGDVARLITRLHDTVEATSRGYVALRKGYHRFVARLGLDQSRLLSAGRIALETSDDPSAIAAALLDFRDQGETTPKDLETGLEEIAVHQVAMLEGVLQGVDALLDELSPEAIERAAPGPRRGLQLTRNSHREWWETYSRRHAELSEEGQALSKLFGPEFASAYQTYRRRRR